MGCPPRRQNLWPDTPDTHIHIRASRKDIYREKEREREREREREGKCREVNMMESGDDTCYIVRWVELIFAGMERPRNADDTAARCVTEDEAVTKALHSLHTWLPSS